ncbi:MAG: type II and III secretion system protein family protein [Planctomycetota bacterium]|jgi:pilus assembly protein CpaC
MRPPIKGRGIPTARVWFVLIVILIGGPLAAYAPAMDSENVSIKPEAITFLLGESTIVKAPWPTVRVAVTEPAIANVQVLTPRQVLLQGLKVGSTDLIVWSADETQVKQWKVQVKLDTSSFKAKLDNLFPGTSLEVDQSGESLVISGLLRSAEQVTMLRDLLDSSKVPYVDMTSLAGVQQVQLEVRIAEVSRVALRALGINMFHTNDDYFAGLLTGGSSGALVPSIDIGVPEGTPAGNNLAFQFNQNVTVSPAVTLFAGFPNSDFQFFLQALIENQAMRLLANPTLVALSGEQANFLAGGEYPIPVVQSTGGGDSITIEYREYGVRVEFLPTVLGDGTIRLHAAPEVSNLTDVGAVVIGGFSVPALTTRKAETTLELKNGQTFAMAGLLQHDDQAINSRIPGLGDLPILGPLFRSVRYRKQETELVVLVTASLVEPMSLASAPPVPGFSHVEPNDWELYVEGRIEGKEPAKIDAEDAKWLEQIGLDQLVGPGAWDTHNKATFPSQADSQEPGAGEPPE